MLIQPVTLVNSKTFLKHKEFQMVNSFTTSNKTDSSDSLSVDSLEGAYRYLNVENYTNDQKLQKIQKLGAAKNEQELTLLGKLYRETKQYDKAVKTLKRAANVESKNTKILVDPKPPSMIQIELGKTYYEMKDYDKAVDMFETQKMLYDMRTTIFPSAKNEANYKEYQNIVECLDKVKTTK